MIHSGRHAIKIAGIIFLLLHAADISRGQQNRVSSKLDFDDMGSETDNNSTVPELPDNVKDVTETKEDKTNKNVVNSGPKIHGVRVTVDTGDSTKESKESVEITDVGKNTKRVGIRTDITFEITGGDDDSGNKTSPKTKEADEEDIPIFKGRHQKSGKPYDSKKNRHLSPEHRIYENSAHGGNVYDYYAEYYPRNVPTYSGYGGTQSGSGASTYNHNRSGWISYIPRTWTTERSYPYRANSVSVSGYREPQWKPCYCITSNMNANTNTNRNHRQLRHNNYQHHRQPDLIVKPTSSLIKIIDGKLESPFSKK